MNLKENRLALGQVTPTPRAAGFNISPPRPPKKRPTPYASKHILNDATGDFTVVCGDGRSIMAHKSILRENSPYFQRMFSFPGKEVTENKVEIKHADPRIMYWVLEFMYTGAYAPPDGTTVSTEYCNHDRASYKYATASAGGILKKKCPCAGKTTSPNHLLAHIHVYSIADYFGMRTLMAFAQQKVVEVLHVHWQDDKLQLKNALEKAFSNTPEYNRGLRQVLIDVLKAHPGLWVDDGDVRSWLDAHLRVREEVDYA